MPKSRTQRTIVNTGTGTVSRIVRIVLEFILRTIFIKTLGIQYAGVSSLFTSVLTVLSFAELGIGSAITFALYEPIAKKDHRQIALLMRFYKTAYRLVAMVVFCGGLCVVPFLKYVVRNVPDIQESITLLYMLYLVKTTSSYLLIYKSALLVASQDSYKISVIDIAVEIGKVILECVALLLVRQYLIYLVIEIIASIGRNIIVSLTAGKDFEAISKYKNEQLPKDEWHRLFKDVGALAMYTISGVVLSSTDDIIISTFVSTTMVGLIANYKLIRTSIDGFITQFFNAVTPSIGNLAVENADGNTQYSIFRKINFANCWISCFCATSFIVLMNPFIGSIWLGKDYMVSTPVVLAIVTDFYITNMIRPVAAFRTANGLFVQGKWRPVFMAVFNIVLSIFLAKPLGVFGILIATSISRFLTQFWYDPWLVFRRVFRRSSLEYFCTYAMHLLITVLSCALTYSVAVLINFGNFYFLFIAKVAMCILIPSGLLFLFFHGSDEWQFIISIISRSLEVATTNLVVKD